jgi:hypothetical protein
MNDECWWLEKITAPWVSIVIHNNSGYVFFEQSIFSWVAIIDAVSGK